MVESEVELHPDIHVPVGGETVAASRYEPTQHDGPLPVVLVVTPYRKDDRITFGSWAPSIHYLCKHGYEVVVADLLGTGASSGDKRPYHREEGEEIATVVEWLADREWSTGDVGMFGLSYGAWTQFATAAVDPEPLKAIVPIAVAPDAYESSVRGGVFNPMKRVTWAAMVQNLRALPPSRRDPEGRWADVWDDHLDAIEGAEPWAFDFLAHEAHDEFWDERAVDPAEIRVPTLAACGYRDDHTAPMVDFFDDVEAPKRLVLGPWRHTMPERGREASTDFRRQAVAWFDRFLKGEENDATDHPTVTYWTEREGGWTPGAGTWRGTDRWPTPETATETLSYAFTPDGLRATGSYDEGEFDRTWELDNTVGVESLDRVGSVENVGVPTNADDARSLTVETGQLESPVEWTGTGTATVRIRPSAEDSLVAVRVSDVAPDGTARLVSGGHLRASHRDGHDDPTPLEPGTVTPIEVSLKPKSHVFEAGHRIRVAVSGAYFPRALPLREQGDFDVVSTPAAPTELTVPGRVHDVEVGFDDETEVSGPDASVPLAPQRKTGLTSRWGVDRNHTADSATLTTETEGVVDLPHGDYRSESAVEARVAADDPSTAYLRSDNVAELEYDTETVRAETTARVARDSSTVTTAVTVDGETVFEKTWRRSNL